MKKGCQNQESGFAAQDLDSKGLSNDQGSDHPASLFFIESNHYKDLP